MNIFLHGFVGFGLRVLGEFAREDEFACAGNRACVESAPLVVLDDGGCFSGDAVEGVSDERVHDGHGFLAHSHLRVHLLQHFEDVQVERLVSLLAAASGGGGTAVLLGITRGTG